MGTGSREGGGDAGRGHGSPSSEIYTVEESKRTPCSPIKELTAYVTYVLSRGGVQIKVVWLRYEGSVNILHREELELRIRAAHQRGLSLRYKIVTMQV